tara:strand:- start:149 stop:2461 length:2313 start_codon:yes stop_codon:yes gene_type:complete
MKKSSKIVLLIFIIAIFLILSFDFTSSPSDLNPCRNNFVDAYITIKIDSLISSNYPVGFSIENSFYGEELSECNFKFLSTDLYYLDAKSSGEKLNIITYLDKNLQVFLQHFFWFLLVVLYLYLKKTTINQTRVREFFISVVFLLLYLFIFQEMSPSTGNFYLIILHLIFIFILNKLNIEEQINLAIILGVFSLFFDFLFIISIISVVCVRYFFSYYKKSSYRTKQMLGVLLLLTLVININSLSKYSSYESEIFSYLNENQNLENLSEEEKIMIYKKLNNSQINKTNTYIEEKDYLRLTSMFNSDTVSRDEFIKELSLSLESYGEHSSGRATFMVSNSLEPHKQLLPAMWVFLSVFISIIFIDLFHQNQLKTERLLSSLSNSIFFLAFASLFTIYTHIFSNITSIIFGFQRNVQTEFFLQNWRGLYDHYEIFSNILLYGYILTLLKEVNFGDGKKKLYLIKITTLSLSILLTNSRATVLIWLVFIISTFLFNYIKEPRDKLFIAATSFVPFLVYSFLVPYKYSPLYLPASFVAVAVLLVLIRTNRRNKLIVGLFTMVTLLFLLLPDYSFLREQQNFVNNYVSTVGDKEQEEYTYTIEIEGSDYAYPWWSYVQYNYKDTILESPMNVVGVAARKINREVPWSVFLSGYKPDVNQFVFGFGPGAQFHLARDIEPNVEALKSENFDPHSIILSILSRFGILGLIFYLVAFLLVMKNKYVSGEHHLFIVLFSVLFLEIKTDTIILFYGWFSFLMFFNILSIVNLNPDNTLKTTDE